MGDRLRRRWAIPTGFGRPHAAGASCPAGPTPATLPQRSSRCQVVALPGPCASRVFLDTVTSRVGSLLQRMRGTTPFRYRERTCARAPGGVRWGPMVNALGFQRRCYRVIGHLRARHVLGKTHFLDEGTRASPGHESTWRFRRNQQKPSNKCFRRNACGGMDLGPFVEGIVGHLDGLFEGLPGTRFSA